MPGPPPNADTQSSMTGVKSVIDGAVARYPAAIAFVAGLLYPLAFALFDWSLLAVVSLAILFIVIDGRTPKLAAASERKVTDQRKRREESLRRNIDHAGDAQIARHREQFKRTGRVESWTRW